MDAETISASEPIIGSFFNQAVQSFQIKKYETMNLFKNRKIPDVGWSEGDIELLLHNLSIMDSNNFPHSCGVGEREARFASNLVARRHYRMGHGIGRSGYVTELQPKAAGSSLLNQLTNSLLLDVLKSFGAPSTSSCIVLPVATGMCMTLCLRAFHAQRPKAKFVIWSRIDQKSCFKCIITAGLTPVIVDCLVLDDQLITNTQAILDHVERIGAQNVVCVVTTTSCFAPRNPDDLERVADICADFNVPHLVNNAYGLQCGAYMEMIDRASQIRVDAYVASTDKNFMVPVGGSIVASSHDEVVDAVAKMYPGRGSASPSMDIFITLLNIGKQGYRKLIDQRNELFQYLKSELEIVAKEFGERVLCVKGNHISVGLSLEKFTDVKENLVTEIGSMLFSKFVSGARVIRASGMKVLEGYEFPHWGSHSTHYNGCYLTAAATVGVTKVDIDEFIKRLRSTLLSAQKTVVQITAAKLISNSQRQLET